jgi:TatD DNase family protein
MTPEFIDSHCHLEPKDFAPGEEREAVIERARQAGVTRLVCIGSGASLDEVRNAVGLAETHDNLWAAVGIHPHDVARMPDGALDEIERLATTHPRVVAVGETGLDYHYNHSPPEAQKESLRTFAQIARRAKKPLSLHIRDAHDDALAILTEERADEFGGVVHCFTGNLANAKRWVALGFAVSFSGIVTFPSAGPIREAAAWVPADRVLLETDCPYLAPVPLRGKKNEPAYLVHTAALVARTRGVELAQLADETRENTVRLFRL